MKAFKNDNIIDKLCGGCDCSDFSAAVSFDYDADAKTVVFTDASQYGAGAARKIVHVAVHDGNGEHVHGSIAENDGDDAVTLSTATLDPSRGLKLTATVVSDKGCISDGHAEAIGVAITTGELGSWDKDNNALTIGSDSADSGS